MDSNNHDSRDSSPEICRPTLVKTYTKSTGNSRKLYSLGNRRGLEYSSPYEKCPFSLAADEKTKKKAENEFDLYSNEEIDNDFRTMKTKSEILEVSREILSILHNSTAPNSITNNEKEEKCERVHNPFFKNLENDK